MTRDARAIRVLVADDHAVVREGIRHVLDGAEFDVVGEASNGHQAVELAHTLAPDVVILDLSMPGLSGLDAVPLLRDRSPDARILVLSIHDREEYVVQSVRLGAQGYLRKDSTPAELRGAVRAVHEGSSFFGAGAAESVSAALRGAGEGHPSPRRLASLTAREREVLIAIARGGTNREIASQLGISVRTVESHREAVMKKLGLRGAAAVARFAIDAGLLRISADS
jgi:NarL family two-component system response regulator LiaR